MTVRNVLGMLGALAMAFMLSAAPVEAKGCRALCKTVIKDCIASKCTTKPKGKCKRLECKKRIIDYCKDNAKTCPASPSGAFLD